MRLEISIDVDDLDRAVRFYCDGLGLLLIERGADWAHVRLGEQTLWLCGFAVGAPGSVARDFRRHWTPVHLDFLVGDLEETLRRALAAGGRLEGQIRRGEREPAGLCDVANLRDPAGNGVDLVHRHGDPRPVA